MFLSRGLYGPRPSTHIDAYLRQPGWLVIEVGAWTLEVDYPPAIHRLLKGRS